MYDYYLANRKKIDKFLMISLFVIFIIAFVRFLYGYVAPFAIAFILSLIFEPLASLLTTRFKIRRGLASLVCILILIFLVSFLSVNFVSRIMMEAKAFVVALPGYIAGASTAIEGLKVTYADYMEFIPGEFKELTLNIVPSLMGFVTSTLGSGVKSSSYVVLSSVPGIFMGTLVCVISTFFFIKDKENIRKAVTENGHPILIQNIRFLKSGLIDALGGYIRAQLIIMSVVGSITVLGLTILKYPYSLFIGLIIAVVDALPIMGSGFVLWPWAFITAILGNYKGALALLILYGVNTVTRQSLEPKVLSSQIGLHPIIILMSIYIGLKVFGGIGFFVGPLIVIVVKIMRQINYVEIE